MTHDMTEPDPLCMGDDPCVCWQLNLARIQALQAAMFVIDKGGRAENQILALLGTYDREPS